MPRSSSIRKNMERFTDQGPSPYHSIPGQMCIAIRLLNKLHLTLFQADLTDKNETIVYI